MSRNLTVDEVNKEVTRIKAIKDPEKARKAHHRLHIHVIGAIANNHPYPYPLAQAIYVPFPNVSVPDPDPNSFIPPNDKNPYPYM